MAIAGILKGNPKYLRASLAQGHDHIFLWVMMGLGKPQLYAKLEVAGFIYYGNIREFVFIRQIHFLGYPCLLYTSDAADE